MAKKKKRGNCNRVNPLTRTTLEDQGYMVALVEQTIPGTRGIKRDLYGFLDFLAVNQYETLGVQATSLSNASHRRKKILTERAEEAKQWLSFPGRRLEVWGWGWDEKTKSWFLNAREITLGDFDGP
mgnify:CR=1 FL=1|tara:strand:+ start:1784 stop:2161 length:378 start_codon:yes stop_codon:yes gene_type:complete